MLQTIHYLQNKLIRRINIMQFRQRWGNIPFFNSVAPLELRLRGWKQHSTNRAAPLELNRKKNNSSSPIQLQRSAPIGRTDFPIHSLPSSRGVTPLVERFSRPPTPPAPEERHHSISFFSQKLSHLPFFSYLALF